MFNISKVFAEVYASKLPTGTLYAKNYNPYNKVQNISEKKEEEEHNIKMTLT